MNRHRPVLLFSLCLTIAVFMGCEGNLLRNISDANPLLSRLAGASREEILAMPPPQRYAQAFRFVISETGNLARGAEEGEEIRSGNASARIIDRLVIMLGAVDDASCETRLIGAMRDVIRLGESIVLGSKNVRKATYVRRMRDEWKTSLHPSKVTRYMLMPPEVTRPTPPSSELARGLVVRKRLETVLENGKEVTRYVLVLKGDDGVERILIVSRQAYDQSAMGSTYGSPTQKEAQKPPTER